MKKLLIIAVIMLLTNVVNAQKKEYNFASTVYGSGSNCPDVKKAVYFSPVVSCTIEATSSDDIQEGRLVNKWEKKVFAKYTLKTYCHYTTAWVWDSFGKVDEKRDEMIAEYKDLGYKVYSDYTFGFHFTRYD